MLLQLYIFKSLNAAKATQIKTKDDFEEDVKEEEKIDEAMKVSDSMSALDFENNNLPINTSINTIGTMITYSKCSSTQAADSLMPTESGVHIGSYTVGDVNLSRRKTAQREKTIVTDILDDDTNYEIYEQFMRASQRNQKHKV